jgi:hypothetical protein
LGVISGFTSDFKSIEPQMQSIVPFLIEELSAKNP